MNTRMIIDRGLTKLALTAPFFGSIALSLRWSKDDSIDTMCTDGRECWYSEAFTQELHNRNPLEVIGVQAHEAFHVAVLHPLRRGNRDPKRWNCAADFEANLILLAEGFVLPEGALVDHQYAGLTAEQIYDRLPADFDGGDGGKMGEFTDPKNSQGKDLTETEVKQMKADIKAKVMMAAETARMRGNMPASLQGMIDKMKRAEIDLHSVMEKFMGGVNPDDWSTVRPNRRKLKSQRIVAPTIVKSGCGHVVFSIDSSGSVHNRELQYFLGVANQMVEEMRPDSVTVITWDARVRTVKRYESGDDINGIEIGGRGGTLVSPSFRYVEDEGVECDQMIVLTDMGIHDWPDEPEYPVLWVSTWDAASSAPFGQTTYLNCA